MQQGPCLKTISPSANLDIKYFQATERDITFPLMNFFIKRPLMINVLCHVHELHVHVLYLVRDQHQQLENLEMQW